MSVQDQIEIIIPSSPADQEELFKAIKEISASMTRVDGEKEYQKESYEALEEKFQIKAKYLRRLAADYHKDQFDKKASEHDEYARLYETIIKDA